MNKTFAYYKDYLGFIEDSIRQILIHDRIYLDTALIIRDNPKLNKNNPFLTWMMRAYISDITIRIRRLTDKRKDVQSLIKFLEEVKRDGVIRSRKHHVDLYRTPPFFLEEEGEKSFDYLAGKGSQEYSKDKVQKDLELIQEICETILDYTNTFVSHSRANVKSGRKLATFEDIRKAIKTLDQIIIKYFLLIKAANRGKSLLPDLGTDWITIFNRPWSE